MVEARELTRRVLRVVAAATSDLAYRRTDRHG
jgi:hypothetical protein